MKRILFILLATVMNTAVCSAAMSNSRVRKETRFLTDKMAYELNLSTAQYNDVYEINYDFIYGIRDLIDHAMRGEEWALNRYYDYLDVRNDDLRWVLSSRQYGRFMQAAYFYRPIHIQGGHWSFRIYLNYTNHNHFYFPKPHHYRTYCGGHYRTHYHDSYYRGRYHHPHYTGSWSIKKGDSFHSHIRSDFGSIQIRPASGKRPAKRDEVYTTRRSQANGGSRTGRVSSHDSRSGQKRNESAKEVRNETKEVRKETKDVRKEAKDDKSVRSTRGTRSTRSEKSREASSVTRSSSAPSSRSSSTSSRSSSSRSSRSSERDRR